MREQEPQARAKNFAEVTLGYQPEEALREAVQTLLAVKPQLRMEAAIRRYLDEEITLGRAAELTGVSRWRFQELLAQRDLSITLEASPAKELDEEVERIRRRRP